MDEEDLGLLVTYGASNHIEQVFDGFWKNLCECKLMPLTTDYFPNDTVKNNKTKYSLDPRQAVNVTTKKKGIIQTLDDYLREYICLRLSQNF